MLRGREFGGRGPFELFWLGMTREEFENIVLNYVRRNPGCTGVELVTGIVEYCKHDMSQYPNALSVLWGLVREGRLREEEYTDPSVPYRVKSRYMM